MDIKVIRDRINAGIPVRVQSHPATDAWMRGDRYGSVTKVGRKWVHVRMDRSGRTLRFTPDNIDSADD